jgi:hypothetical protein
MAQHWLQTRGYNQLGVTVIREAVPPRRPETKTSVSRTTRGFIWSLVQPARFR